MNKTGKNEFGFSFLQLIIALGIGWYLFTGPLSGTINKDSTNSTDTMEENNSFIDNFTNETISNNTIDNYTSNTDFVYNPEEYYNGLDTTDLTLDWDI